LALALLGHLFTVAIKERGLGLTINPVSMIWRQSPRRLSENSGRSEGEAD